MSEKLHEFSILNGETIVSVEGGEGDHNLHFKTLSGKNISIHISCDGDYGNDSNAYFTNFDGLNSILNQEVVVTSAEDGSDITHFAIKTRNSIAAFQIVHEHNGYYGYSYTVSVNGKF